MKTRSGPLSLYPVLPFVLHLYLDSALLYAFIGKDLGAPALGLKRAMASLYNSIKRILAWHGTVLYQEEVGFWDWIFICVFPLGVLQSSLRMPTPISRFGSKVAPTTVFSLSF